MNIKDVFLTLKNFGYFTKALIISYRDNSSNFKLFQILLLSLNYQIIDMGIHIFITIIAK